MYLNVCCSLYICILIYYRYFELATSSEVIIWSKKSENHYVMLIDDMVNLEDGLGLVTFLFKIKVNYLKGVLNPREACRNLAGGSWHASIRGILGYSTSFFIKTYLG